MNLVAERRNRGLSLTAAAAAMKITRASLEKAEVGDEKISERVAKAIADFYGYRVTEIWPVEDAAA